MAAKASFLSITSPCCNPFVIIPIFLTWKMRAHFPGTKSLCKEREIIVLMCSHCREYLKLISKDNHVKFTRFVLLAVGEEAKRRPGSQVNVFCRGYFFVRSMRNKAFIRFGFCDIQNNQSLRKSYQPWLFWISQKPHPIIVENNST